MAFFSNPANPRFIDFMWLVIQHSNLIDMDHPAVKSKLKHFPEEPDLPIGTLTPEFSPTGQEPGTHHVIKILVDAVMKADLLAFHASLPPPKRNKIRFYFESDGHTWSSVLTAEGIQRISVDP